MISAIGISVVDHITIIDGFKDTGGTFGTEKYMTEGGGMAATAMCAASKLGSATNIFTRIGDDLSGKFIIEGLKSYGVSVSGIKIIEGKKSAVSFVFVDSLTGEKQFYSEKVKSAWVGEEDGYFNLLDNTDVLLVDGHWIEFAVKACEKVRTKGVPVVADFKRMYPGVNRLFPFIDYFIVPLCYDKSQGERWLPVIFFVVVMLKCGKRLLCFPYFNITNIGLIDISLHNLLF